MPILVVQRGHCYRKTGATGTTGEQAYATAVADACVRLLHGKSGWTVRPTLADENYYRGDAFVAIHCDGSTNPSARGASIGYRTPEGQVFGQAWKRFYAAHGWVGGFRPDNYTTALAQYYGTGNAVAAGNRRAVILECGFRTNAADRALLDGPGGPERVALAIGDALGIATTPPPIPEDPTVKNLILAREKSGVRVWVGDGITRRWVEDPTALSGLQYWIGQKGGDKTVYDFDDVRVLGVDVAGLVGQLTDDEANVLAAIRALPAPGDVDEQTLADALAPILAPLISAGATPAQVTEAIRAAFARAGQPEGV